MTPLLRDPLQAQRFITQRANQPEDLGQPLYDRVNYAAAGSTELNFFSTVRGQSATLISAGATGTISKSYRDTNMDSANVVPNKLFLFIGVSIAFVHEDEGEAANATDRDKIRSASYLHLRFVDKDILYLPTIFIPESNPFVVNTMNSSMGTAVTSGCTTPMFALRVPVTLNPFEQFTAKIIVTGTVTTTKAVDVYLMLHGWMRRPS